MSKKSISIVALLVAAQVNLSALVPAVEGQGPPPWWVGSGLLWPFFNDTATLLPAGGVRDLLTPFLGVAAAGCFLLAVAAVAGWRVPQGWLRPLVIAGATCSIVLHVAWLSVWAAFPLAVDAALLWALYSGRLVNLESRGRAAHAR